MPTRGTCYQKDTLSGHFHQKQSESKLHITNIATHKYHYDKMKELFKISWHFIWYSANFALPLTRRLIKFHFQRQESLFNGKNFILILTYVAA